MDRVEKTERNCAVVILAIVGAIFLSICIRFIVKNVVYEGLGIYNEFVRFWLPDDAMVNKDLMEQEGEEIAPVEIDWAELYPFEDGEPDTDIEVKNNMADNYKDLVANMENKIDLYTNNLLLYRYECILTTAFIEKVSGWNIVKSIEEEEKDRTIFFMNNGYLAETKNKMTVDEIDEVAESINDLAKYCRSLDIPLIFACAGSNVCPHNKMHISMLDFANDNSDLLLEKLKSYDIDTLDFRKEMIDNGLNWDEYYYRTDHHWTTMAGLWAAGVLADKLNRDYGFNFDKKYFEPDSYKITHFDDFWLGSRGRIVTLVRTSLDSYDLIEPKFTTNMTLSRSLGEFTVTGSYDDVILRIEDIEKIKGYKGHDYLVNRDAYGSTNTGNTALLKIDNNSNTDNNGKKILLFRDSFSNYLLSYLSCDIEKMEIMNINQFNGSVKKYIEESKPDILVIIHYVNAIKPIDWTTHKDYFDFR